MFRREIKIQANVLFFMLFSMSYCVLPVWYIEKVTLFVRWLLFNGFLAVSLWLLFQEYFIRFSVFVQAFLVVACAGCSATFVFLEFVCSYGRRFSITRGAGRCGNRKRWRIYKYSADKNCFVAGSGIFVYGFYAQTAKKSYFVRFSHTF